MALIPGPGRPMHAAGSDFRFKLLLKGTNHHTDSLTMNSSTLA